jgi:hypothetical protein
MLPYTPAVDIFDLIAVSDVMEAGELGPNGALTFCMEFLEANVAWLEERLRPLLAVHTYLIFDTPGQAELYCVHDGLARILEGLAKSLDLRFVALHLVDSHHCSDPYKFVAAATLSLQAMLRLGVPHLNVLSKVDLAHNFLGADFGLESFTEDLDLARLLPMEEEEGGGGGGAAAVLGGPPEDEEEADVLAAVKEGAAEAARLVPPALRRAIARRRTFSRKLRSLNERLVGVLQDYNLISFAPVSVLQAESLVKLLKAADSAHGFVPVR